ncbi:CHEK1 family protein [Megaselia abdita]
MKMVDLKKHPDAVLSIKKEVCIQKILQDPHILRYFGKRSQGDIEYLFLEYAAGGELFDRIEPDVGMPQREAQRYFNQLLSGVQYLHLRGVAHRDLKPENILLDEHDNIKISDFGMATMFRLKGKERLLDKRCGTLPYVAPEVLVKLYHAQPADIWSCGVILVTMLAGELPWDQPSSNCQEYLNWKENERWQTLTPWRKLDTLAVALLRKILMINPSSRLSVDKILDHKWCQMQFSDSDLKSHDTTDSFARSPSAKRQRSSMDILAQDSFSRDYFTQPMPVLETEFLSENTKEEQNRNPRITEDGNNNPGFCFSQPALLDDLLLCTQNQTQSMAASQNVFQRLVRRMTRFFVTTKHEDSVRLLSVELDKLGYTHKLNDDNVMTISTIDRRKLKLVFKAHIIEMDGKILLDFRLSKGCGLEFKRRFMKIKQSLSCVVMKGPITWPIAIATNCVP